jgi:hypothetical protein
MDEADPGALEVVQADRISRRGRARLDKKRRTMASLAMASDLARTELAFPVTYDLRLIYVLAEGASIREDLERILAARGTAWTLMQGDAKSGARYGRFGVRVTMTSREQMYGVYEDLGMLKYIKTAI